VVSGLVLAGGMGRRWGGPKAWARLPDERTFLDACVGLLCAGGAVTVAATLPPGTRADQLVGVTGLPLPGPDLDMFASIRLGLAALMEHRWDAAVLLPVDHPLVAPATIGALVVAGPPAAIPCLAGRHGHPICLWRPAAEGVVAGRLAGPTLREVLKAVGAVDVEVDDRGIRANCNTPEALAEALGS
jgi:CTP:molybdopterin cytidylyltransferase MocA